MKKWLLYACEQQYGGLHGIEDYCVIEAPNEQNENFIYSEYIPEMSREVMGSYNFILEDLIDKEDYDSEEKYWKALDEAIQENIGGYVVQVRDDVTESVEELNKILCRLGHGSFRDEYCII